MKPSLNLILILPLFCVLTLKAQHKEAYDRPTMEKFEEEIPKFEDDKPKQTIISIYNPFKEKISFQMEFRGNVTFVSIDPEKKYLIEVHSSDEYHFAIGDLAGNTCKGTLLPMEKSYRICVDLNEKKYCICPE